MPAVLHQGVLCDRLAKILNRTLDWSINPRAYSIQRGVIIIQHHM